MNFEPSPYATDFSSEENELLAYLLEQEGIADYQQPETTSRRERAERMALSFGQQRLWYLDHLNPESPVYNIPLSIHLQGKLQVDVLRESLQAIARRHEILRTTIEEQEGQPLQVIYATIEVPFDIVDMRALPASERQRRAEELAQQEATQPFNLSCLPLWRTQLLRLADEEWLFLLNFHHSIFDGWSVGVFFKELSHYYQAYSMGKEPVLNPLPMQFADYTLWQQAQEQQEVYARQREYWQKQFHSVPTLLDLPKDYPRPLQGNFSGENLPVRLDAVRSQLLRTLAQQEECSIYMVLLAIWLTLLYRYSNSEELVVGTPVANRPNVDTEQLIGFFTNTLALRVFTGDNPTFRELLGRVREVALQAYEHQDLPIEQVVGLVQPLREVSTMPLVQVFFAFQTMAHNQLHLPGVEATSEYRQTYTAKFDLLLELFDDTEIHGTLEYSTELFKRERIQRMIGHLDTLFGVITNDPEQRLSDFPLLTEAEEQQLLFTWNQTQAAYPQELCLHTLIEAQVERTPTTEALVVERQSLTYDELNCRANQLAHYLQTVGVGSDVLVGLCMERSVEMVVALLGVLKAGGAYVPLDPDYPQERLDFMLQDSQAAVLLTQAHLSQRFQDTRAKVICLDQEAALLAQEKSTNPRVSSSPEHLAYVIYTSGSTGQPKGVMITHRCVVNFLCTIKQKPGLSAADTFFSLTTLSFDIAALELFLPLIVGARLALSRTSAADTESVLYWLKQTQATVLQGTPATWRMLLAAGWKNDGTLKKLLCGGEALSPDLATLLLAQGGELWNMYGPTETTIWSSIYHVEEIQEGRSLPIGRPIANTQFYILDTHLRPVPIGVVGELYIGGDGLARGYLNRPELTTEKFVRHPFRSNGSERLYKSGDLANYLPDGTIEFLGRNDHQIKLRGFRIELGEIETALNNHPAIHQSVVIVREDAHEQKRLVAYIVLNQEQSVSREELRMYLQQHLPAYMVPASFVFLATLPLTANGKVNRRALPEPGQSSSQSLQESLDERPGFSTAYVPPRNEMECSITALWEEYLDVRPIGIHDRFEELGGDSLLLLQLSSRLCTVFHVRLSVRDFLAGPTIAQVATLIAQRMAQLLDSAMLEQLLNDMGA